MSNATKITLVSRDFVKLVRPILNEQCTVDAETGDRACISRPALAALVLKANRKALPTKNIRVLVTMLEAAEQAGQFPGFESRRGRDGGLFKAEVKKPRKPRKTTEAVKATEAETPQQKAA